MKLRFHFLLAFAFFQKRVVSFVRTVVHVFADGHLCELIEILLGTQYKHHTSSTGLPHWASLSVCLSLRVFVCVFVCVCMYTHCDQVTKTFDVVGVLLVDFLIQLQCMPKIAHASEARGL